MQSPTFPATKNNPFNPHVLKYLRRQARLSQDELAQRVGLHDKSQISRYESGTTIPKADTLGKLLQVLQPRPELLLHLFNMSTADEVNGR